MVIQVTYVNVTFADILKELLNQYLKVSYIRNVLQPYRHGITMTDIYTVFLNVKQSFVSCNILLCTHV